MGINGFININKPKDMTSNRALQILKRKLSEQNIKEKISSCLNATDANEEEA